MCTVGCLAERASKSSPSKSKCLVGGEAAGEEEEEEDSENAGAEGKRDSWCDKARVMTLTRKHTTQLYSQTATVFDRVTVVQRIKHK